jgi:hypothetical protein
MSKAYKDGNAAESYDQSGQGMGVLIESTDFKKRNAF